MIDITWTNQSTPGAVRAQSAEVDQQRVEVRMAAIPDGWAVTIRFYVDGRRMETWHRAYRGRGWADDGYQEVKRRAERWLRGLGLRGLCPAKWHRTVG